MRNFENPGRSEALGRRGMAAASHPLATQAALDVLKAGGNAVDAAICAAALLAVVEPTQTGIGGDCFVLLKRKGQPVIALEGAGWAPAAASVANSGGLHASEINPQSAAAVTIPGAIGAWSRLSQDYGSWPWPRLFEPAIDAAAHGVPVAERLARDWARQTAKLSQDADTAGVFLRAGVPYGKGEIHSQPLLSKALSSIAAEGPKAFYEGWIAKDIIRKLERLGGVHQLDDFSAWAPRYLAPISTVYRGYRLWECPPSGQGVIALGMAAMLENYDLASYGHGSVERYHLLAEVARLAYAERDHYLCESSEPQVMVSHLLDQEKVRQRISRIRMDRRMADATPLQSPAHQDTVYLTVVDEAGTAVSFINSIFDDFGSGIMAPESGILLHNRGCGFVLKPEHPNVIAGRKRPMHTIIPALLTQGDDVVLSFGCTGAHFQPLGQIQMLTNIVDYGMGVQEAIDAPRMYAHGDVLHLEGGVPLHVWNGLRALGHDPRPAPNPLGAGQAIWMTPSTGVLCGGADSRRDGIALGY
ncbi:MAG: gamma-glutamyltransferase [Ottowia sp.]|uniref:gamma-glutamyltransferase n=1 Tax=Ottowia sp. TaxID=1898956 RepID=UPI003C7611CC